MLPDWYMSNCKHETKHGPQRDLIAMYKLANMWPKDDITRQWSAGRPSSMGARYLVAAWCCRLSAYKHLPKPI